MPHRCGQAACTSGKTADSGNKSRQRSMPQMPPAYNQQSAALRMVRTDHRLEDLIMLNKALDKLNQKPDKLSQKAKAVSDGVRGALIEFCKQNSEFSQAVVQSEKSVAECLEYVVKGCGSCLSDIAAYERAARFYFAGAKVHFQMILDLGDGGFSGENKTAVPPEAPTKKCIMLDLDELLKG